MTTTLLKIATAALAGLVFASAAMAQNVDVIKKRQQLFKDYLPHSKAGAAMIKGEAEFDLAKAKAVFSNIAEISKQFPDLFPADSKEGAETRALPVIWEKTDDFKGRFLTLSKAASDAADSIDDEFAFRDAWPKVMGNCGGCHKVYRAEKK